jgi:pyruvate formate lyase activating enzyme
VDYPSKISAVIFTQGCNFTCPYCQNPDLVRSKGQPLDRTYILGFLSKRRPLLDGVVISGGEPTIHGDLPDFLKEIKTLGYPIKLDTNGSRPQALRTLLEGRLIDYAALDLKADPLSYPSALAEAELSSNIMESISVLKNSLIAHEFRTTCAAPFVDARSISAIAKSAAGQASLYLQPYRGEVTLNPEFMAKHPRQPNPEDLLRFKELAEAHLPCFIRD